VAVSQGLMMDWEGYQLTWTNIKPRFQHQLATQLATQRDDKLIIKGLSNLAMRPNELTGKLLVRITNTMVIIKEKFFKMQLFQVALPREIQKVVAQHDQTTMTLDDMYWIMTTTQRDACSKKSTKSSQL